MKTCHVCLALCEDDAELCPICGAELISEEPESTEETTENEEVVVLTTPTLAVTVEDVVTGDIFRDLLTENGIPFACDTDGDQNAMRVTFGGSFVAEEIYVNEEDVDRAKALYEEALASEPLFDDFDFEDFEEEI